MTNLVNFYYDPARQGYSTTHWKTVTGTPISGEFDIFPAQSDALSVAESLTMGSLAIPNSSFSDTGSVTEAVTVLRI